MEAIMQTFCSHEKEMGLYSLYNQCLHNISAFPFFIPRLDAFLLLSELKTAEHNVSLPKIPERLPPDFTGSVASQVQELNFIAVLLVNSDVMVMAAIHTNFRENWVPDEKLICSK